MFANVLTRALALACLLVPALAAAETTAPDVQATAAFPESNPFHHVVNGERNAVTISVENLSDLNVTVSSVAGSVHLADSGKLIKNLTALSYNVPLIKKGKIQVPYTFYSEFRPGDLQLKLWVEYTAPEGKHRVQAFESVVSVVEPPASLFDLKMLATYIIVAGVLGGLGYAAFLNYGPGAATSKGKGKKRAPAAEPVAADAVPVKGSGVYSEDWIPEHHLKQRRKKADGALSSGDESGVASGTERRKSSRRK
ncbi:hypothetical protein AURDEDRAFT_112506 [Auricularia subglabra TFB-10046 SS5]|nr:hypothetical protein AURDEDRAFT_112506 [Auricularia subglabra TFB-10046 SS5]